MLRLRLFLCSVVLGLAISASLIVSCGRDKPTAPTDRLGAPRATIIPLGDRDGINPKVWYAQTSEQLDSLLDVNTPPFLISQDEILLKPDTLFNLGAKEYDSQDVQQLSIYTDTDSLPATIRSTRINTGDVMTFRGEDASGSRFEFRNIEIDADSVTAPIAFLNLFEYEDVRFSEVTGNLGMSYLYVGADSTTLYDCQLAADRRCVDFVTGTGATAAYVVDSSSLQMISSAGTRNIVNARFNNGGGSILIKDSYFTSTSTGTKHFLECTISSGETEDISVVIQGNSFDDDVTLLLDNPSGSGDITYSLTYDSNHWPSDHCPPDFIVHESVTLDLDSSEMEWLWNNAFASYSYIWADIGQIESVAHTKKYCDSAHYVSAAFDFSADTLDVFHAYEIPTVNFGSSRGSLTSTADVCWATGVDKWIAEMNVDWCETKSCSLFWETTITHCDSTGTSAVQAMSFRMDTGPCKDPLVCD